MSTKLNVSMLYQDVSHMIEQARASVAHHANSTLILLYWHVGDRVNQELLQGERAEYGKQIIETLSQQLVTHYGSGFDRTNVSRMSKLSRLFSDKRIITALSPNLSWSHFVLLMAIDDTLKRDFYTEMCRLEKWAVRTLKSQIDGMLYERTALAKQPENVIRQQIDSLRSEDKLTPAMIFKDPYILKFEGLRDDYSESDLENTILNEMSTFIQEMGSNFCFVARQKRMSTDHTDRYLDLLFYQRKLRRLVAIELKLGRFEPEHKGQMEWYLNWLDKHERIEGEEKPVGIILCADKNETDIEYLSLGESGIHVAQYLTELPPRELLEERLKEVTATAQARAVFTIPLKKDGKPEANDE